MNAYRVSRSAINAVLLAALSLTWLAGAAPVRVAAQEFQADPIRVRIGVTVDGIVQLAPADLTAAGVDLATVDPRTFAMSSLGQPVAIAVTGDADGSFDGADTVVFFGQKFRGTEFQEKYTGERVYWLDIGGAAGPRITDVDATPLGDLTPPQSVAATVRARVPLTYWNVNTLAWVNITQETWFWARLKPTIGGPATADLPYEVPDPVPDKPATLRLQALPRYANSVSGQPEHRTTVGLNGVALLDQTWSGSQVALFTAGVAPGILVDGLNTAQVGAQVMPGNVTDDVYFPYWEIDYRRWFRARQGQFDFRAEASGPHEYAVAAWPSKNVAIWDISDAELPRVLGGALPEQNGDGIKLRFRTDDVTGSRYWLQSESSFNRPATIRVRPPTGLRNPAGADSVLITPAAFRPAAERLAEWHHAHGRRTVIADLQDVYDEFNDGTAIAPEAIPNMLKWAVQHWPAPAPTYLTLIGDGHWNIKGFNPATYGTTPSYIPPYLSFVDAIVGEVPTDERYGDVNDDGYAELAVGRLAVNSLVEANVVVDKIRNYDETERRAGWQRRVLFVADNADAGGDFAALSDDIIANYLPSDLSPTRAYLPPRPATAAQIEATRAVISDTMQSGVWMVQFTGHGNVQVWAGEALLTAAMVPGFKNGARLPISMSFNCLDGYFAFPQADRQSIAESLQRQSGGGAIAVISPSGDGFSADQQQLRRILMTIMFEEDVREIGTALNLAKRRFAGPNLGMHYLVQTVTLFGDPALRLPIAGPALQRTYLPAVLR